MLIFEGGGKIASSKFIIFVIVKIRVGFINYHPMTFN